VAGRVNTRVRCTRCHTSYITGDEDFLARKCSCPVCGSVCAQEQRGQLGIDDETPWSGYNLHDWHPSDPEESDDDLTAC
jgi:hypothetical protein